MSQSNPTTAAAWAEKALSGAMIPGGVGMVNEYRARVGRAIESYARQQVEAERVAWGSKLCSHHQIPEVSCDVCNHYLWGQWIVEYNEKSVAFIVSVSHPNIRYPLKHGQSVAAAVRQSGV